MSIRQRNGCVTDSISRRTFVKAAAVSSLAMNAWWAEAKHNAVQDSRLMLAGTETGASSKGIYAFQWDPATGNLKELGLAGESNNPTRPSSFRLPVAGSH